MNKEKFNSSVESTSQFDAWESVRSEFEANETRKAAQANSELSRQKAREEALLKGERDFDSRQQKLIARNNETNYKEYANLHDHLYDLENGNSAKQEVQESVRLSESDLTQAINANADIAHMSQLAKRFQLAQSEEAKAKFQKEMAELSNRILGAENGLSVADWHDNAQWDVKEKSKDYEYRSAIVNQIWETAMTSPEQPAVEENMFAKALSEANTEAQPAVLNNSQEGITSHRQDNLAEIIKSEGLDSGQMLRQMMDAKNNFARENGGVWDTKLQQTVFENPEDQQKYNDLLADIDQVRKLRGLESQSAVSEKESSKEAKKRGLFSKIGNFFSRPRVKKIMTGAVLGGMAASLFMGGQKQNEPKNSNNNEPKTEKLTQSETKVAAEEFNNLADAPGSFGNGEKEVSLEKYDASKDIYWTAQNKENPASWGENLADQSNEYIDNYVENSVATDVDQMLAALNHINMAYEGADTVEEMDAIADNAKSNPEAFNKLKTRYQEVMSKAKIYKGGELQTPYKSLYLIDNGDGDLDLAVAEHVDRGGTEIIVEMPDGGKYTFRAECGFQPVNPKVEYRVVTQDEVDTPPPTTQTPPPPTTQTPPPPTTQTPPPPTTQTPPPETPKPKDRSLENPYIYNGITPMGPGEVTPSETPAEANNNVDPAVTPGSAAPGVGAEGADPSMKIDVQYNQEYPGETTAAAQAQDAQNQQGQRVEQQAQQQYNNQQNVDTVNVGGTDVNLDEIRAAQANVYQGNGSSYMNNSNR